MLLLLHVLMHARPPSSVHYRRDAERCRAMRALAAVPAGNLRVTFGHFELVTIRRGREIRPSARQAQPLSAQGRIRFGLSCSSIGERAGAAQPVARANLGSLSPRATPTHPLFCCFESHQHGQRILPAARDAHRHSDPDHGTRRPHPMASHPPEKTLRLVAHILCIGT